MKLSRQTFVALIGIAGALFLAWKFQNPNPVTPESKAQKSSSAKESPESGSTGKPDAKGQKIVSVEVSKVNTVTLRDEGQAVGTLRSRQNVMLRPEVAGRVTYLGFTDGAAVKKGQLLVQLDDTLQKAEMTQAQAQVSIAEANFKRNQELVAENFVAKRVLDESQANLQVAQAQLALAKARLQRMAIVAPFDSTAGIRNINVGDYVKDGADLVGLEDMSRLYVDFRLPERFQSRLIKNQKVELQLDALPGLSFEARIEALDPLVDATGRAVSVRALVNSGATAAASQLRPGMFARVQVFLGVRENALTVPEEAVTPQGGKQFLIKLVAKNNLPDEVKSKLPEKAEWVSSRVEVRLGVREAGWVEVLSGITGTDIVVVAGQQRLQKDYTPVKVVQLGAESNGSKP